MTSDFIYRRFRRVDLSTSTYRPIPLTVNFNTGGFRENAHIFIPIVDRILTNKYGFLKPLATVNRPIDESFYKEIWDTAHRIIMEPSTVRVNLPMALEMSIDRVLRRRRLLST